MKKLIKLLSLAIGVLSVNISTANWEYVVQLPDHIEQEKKSEVYEVLTTFRFPMIANPINVKKYGMETAEAVLANEVEVLQGKLSGVSKGIKLLKLPKSLYQMYCFHSIICEFNVLLREALAIEDKRDREEFCLKKIVKGHWRLVRGERAFSNDCVLPADGAQKSLSEAYIDYMHKEKVQELFWNINSELLLFLQNQACETVLSQEWIQDHISQITGSLFYNLCTAYNEFVKNTKTSNGDIFSHVMGIGGSLDLSGNLLLGNLMNKNQYMKERIIAVVVEEYNLTESVCRVYHGIREGVALIGRQHNPRKSMSFSDGLFAGTVNDGHSGSAIKIAEGSKRLFALDIEKREVLSGNSLVYIPWIIALGSAYGKGEFHHPRSKTIVKESPEGIARENTGRVIVNPDTISEYYIPEGVQARDFLPDMKQLWGEKIDYSIEQNDMRELEEEIKEMIEEFKVSREESSEE